MAAQLKENHLESTCTISTASRSSFMGEILYELHTQVLLISQGESSMEEYFRRMSYLWDQIEFLQPTPKCNCPASKKMSECIDSGKLMVFLKGLNDCFEDTKKQLLQLHPLPRVLEAYNLLLAVESMQRDMEKHSKENYDLQKTSSSVVQGPSVSNADLQKTGSSVVQGPSVSNADLQKTGSSVVQGPSVSNAAKPPESSRIELETIEEQEKAQHN